jgi:T-complex protein 1 subunit gamma
VTRALALTPHRRKGIVLTNDGNAILREIDVSHPAAKARRCSCSGCARACAALRNCTRKTDAATATTGAQQSMIELARTQDEEVGDGTTSVIILGAWRRRCGARRVG